MKIEKQPQLSHARLGQATTLSTAKTESASPFEAKADISPPTTAFPVKIDWINANYRQVAERRFKLAQQHSLPYIVAQQKVGQTLVHHDGSIAYQQILSKTKNTKTFGSDGLAWNSEKSKTKFFCIFPTKSDLTPIGTIDDLYKKGLEAGGVQSLLIANDFLEEKGIMHEEDPAMQAEYRSISRAYFYLLSASGEILPKDQRTADAILGPLSEEERGFAIANVMALSAGTRELVLLKVALSLGFDPNQPSRLLEATPLEHAEHKGFKEAIELLRPFRTR